jgi:hypothetical protein
MAETFDIGDRPIVTVTFREIGTETLVDPDTISFRLRSPNGTVTTETIAEAIHVSTGVYAWELPAVFDLAGLWAVNAIATNPDTAVEQNITVRTTRFP